MRSHHKDEDAQATDRMIAENRDFFRQRSFHLLIWGLLLSAVFGVHSAIAFGYLAPAPGLGGWTWVATVVVAVVASFLFERYHAISPANILSRLLLHLWAGFAVTLVIIGFLGGATALMPGSAHCGSLAAIVGGGFFVSALLVVSRGLLALAMLWWCAAAVMFFLAVQAALFLMVCLTFGGLFLPGLALYASYRVRPSGA
ncbi:MAG: hypothetical protein D6763_08190 [Alphaproteobacteria bacterium]|nr:MAG: hypothetical protein D6763_08190 [Alphaproteobacteria bacterium]